MVALTLEQERMDKIFDIYFDVSDILRSDVASLLDTRDDDSPSWRRGFIRAVVPLIEGLTYSYLSICHAAPELSAKERTKVDPNQRNSTAKRIKMALSAIYRQLHITPAPDFSGETWKDAQTLFSARDNLMHPKTVGCLTFTEVEWERIYRGSVWLIAEFFRLPDLLERRFRDVAGDMACQ